MLIEYDSTKDNVDCGNGSPQKNDWKWVIK